MNKLRFLFHFAFLFIYFISQFYKNNNHSCNVIVAYIMAFYLHSYIETKNVISSIGNNISTQYSVELMLKCCYKFLVEPY